MVMKMPGAQLSGIGIVPAYCTTCMSVGRGACPLDFHTWYGTAKVERGLIVLFFSLRSQSSSDPNRPKKIKIWLRFGSMLISPAEMSALCFLESESNPIN